MVNYLKVTLEVLAEVMRAEASNLQEFLEKKGGPENVLLDEDWGLPPGATWFCTFFDILAAKYSLDDCIAKKFPAEGWTTLADLVSCVEAILLDPTSYLPESLQEIGPEGAVVE